MFPVGNVRPRIPDRCSAGPRGTAERARVVFGAQDGILTTLGIITGVGVAEGDPRPSLSRIFSHACRRLSRPSASTGRQSEREVVQATIEMEKAAMAADPQGEFTEQVAYYKMKGFSAEEAQMIVRL